MTLWDELHGWTPLRLFWQNNIPQIQWVWAGHQPVGGDYYDQFLASLLQLPFNLLFSRQTSLQDLAEASGDMPATLPLSGLILHMSRCGSTLAARQMAALPELRVLSEPYILQKLILRSNMDPQIPDDLRVKWLRLAVRLLGMPRQTGEQRLVIKLDALAGLRLDLLRLAFPGAPWVFLYRQPEEVLVSHRREAAGNLLPGNLDSALLHSDYLSLLSLPQTEYAALVLSHVCQSALRYLPNQGLAVNYRDMPQAAWTVIAPHFGLNLNPSQVLAMQTTARYNAKSRVPQLFQPDSHTKQAEMTPDLLEAAQKWLAQVYADLEKAANLPANCTRS